MRYDTVIYDLDGTLLDTLSDLAAAVNHAMRVMNCPEHSEAAVCSMVGNGMERLIRLALPEGDERFEETLRVFKAYYAEHSDDLTRMYEGIGEMLEKLAQAGIHQAIVSNKGDPFVRDLNEKFFGRWIGIAVGERPDVRRKPAPDSLLKVMEALGTTSERTLYVGDSDVDIVTARNANVDCASVCWGFRTEEQLREAGAKRLFHTPEELAAFVME